MSVRSTTLRRLLAISAIGLLTALSGCDTDGEFGEAGSLFADDFEEPVVYEIALDTTPPHLADGEVEAEGLIVAPEEVSVFVGDELLVWLELVDPTLGEIRPGSLPIDAEFAVDDSGASVRWSPKLEDVGEHDFIFLVVDAAEENLVVGTTSIVVQVLPRFSLIEYGF